MVEDFPYGLIIGVAFFIKHGSVVTFTAGGGFKLAPESPPVLFVSSTGTSPSKITERRAVDWQAETQPSEPEAEKAAIAGRAAWE